MELAVGIDDDGWSAKGPEGEVESAEDEDADDLFELFATEEGS